MQRESPPGSKGDDEDNEICLHAQNLLFTQRSLCVVPKFIHRLHHTPQIPTLQFLCSDLDQWDWKLQTTSQLKGLNGFSNKTCVTPPLLWHRTPITPTMPSHRGSGKSRASVEFNIELQCPLVKESCPSLSHLNCSHRWTPTGSSSSPPVEQV